MKRFQLLRTLTMPAPAAAPIAPFPINAASRGLMVAAFVVYAATGHLESGLSHWPWMALAVLVTVQAGIQVAFLLTWRDPARLMRTWSIVLPIDIAALNLGAAADGASLSVLSIVAIATLYTSSAMFRPPYVITLGVLAAALLFAAHGLTDVPHGTVSVWTLGLTAAVMLGVGFFSANRGVAEQALRERLIQAQAREHRHAEELGEALDAARANEARFEAFAANAPALLLLFDPKGVPIYANQAAGRLGSLGREAVLETLTSGLAPGDGEATREAIRRAIGGDVVELEFRAPLGGVPRDVSTIFFPVGPGAGAIMTDVTGQRELAARLERAREMERLGTLAGGVAHDFNNLLTAVLGNIYLASGEVPADSPARELLAEARSAAERGAGLVRQLLAYSHFEFDTVEPVEISRLIAQTLDVARPGLGAAIEVKADAPDTAGCVNGNFGALQQVLLNLVLNARDAMPTGGRLTIRYGRVHIDGAYAAAGIDVRPGTFHAISVSDTGTGIAADALAHIFEPFYTTKPVGKGTGLGLPTALGILRAHGGWIDVETQEGAGSTFRVLLPVAHPGMERAAA